MSLVTNVTDMTYYYNMYTLWTLSENEFYFSIRNKAAADAWQMGFFFLVTYRKYENQILFSNKKKN